VGQKEIQTPKSSFVCVSQILQEFGASKAIHHGVLSVAIVTRNASGGLGEQKSQNLGQKNG